MRERFASGFDPFVIPFLIGMIFVLGYCLVAMIRVVCEYCGLTYEKAAANQNGQNQQNQQNQNYQQ